MDSFVLGWEQDETTIGLDLASGVLRSTVRQKLLPTILLNMTLNNIIYNLYKHHSEVLSRVRAERKRGKFVSFTQCIDKSAPIKTLEVFLNVKMEKLSQNGDVYIISFK